MNSRKITASILIDSTLDDVWSILSDYNNLASHVPNLVKSYLIPSPPGTIRLFQEGAQNIIGFDFRASLIMDMTEEPVDPNRAIQERKLSFKLVESMMFSNFEGSWHLKTHSRKQRMDPVTKEITIQYTTMLTYSVLVRPKGPVPVIALEWRIREDVPPNLLAMKIAAEKVAARRRQNSFMASNDDNSQRSISSGGDDNMKPGRVWGTEETLGLYMVSAKRMQ